MAYIVSLCLTDQLILLFSSDVFKLLLITWFHCITLKKKIKFWTECQQIAQYL